MYTAFYGLSELPFELSPNPKYLLLTPRHREALANLQYGIAAKKSLTLLLGEAGTGKTTLVYAALKAQTAGSARILHLANPGLTRAEFVQFLARGFGLSAEAGVSKTILLAELEEVLRARRAEGITTALVVDEAQGLSHELLEEIRLLANIESATEKLLPLVLVGQPELSDRLSHPSLRQLKQRVALRCTLGLLDLDETAAYIAGRIRIAGGQPQALFTREAIYEIHARSRGIPRTISVMCDNALVSGFAIGKSPVDAGIVREVCDDFDFGASTPSPLVEQTGRQVIEGSPLAGRSAPVQLAPTLGFPRAAQEEPGAGLFATFGKRKRFSFF